MNSRLALPGLVLLSVIVATSYFLGRAGSIASEQGSTSPRPNRDAKLDRFPPAGYVLPISGRLTDGGGKPLKEGKYKVLVSLYSGAEKGATPDCSSEITLEVGDNGQFASHLDLKDFSGFQADIIDGRLLYLGIRVETDAEGRPSIGSPELTPRICIWPVLFAKNAGLLSGVTWEHIDERLRKLEEKTRFLSVPDRNKKQ